MITCVVKLPDGIDAQATRATADDLLSVVAGEVRAGQGVVLHGEGSSCWPAVRLAMDLELGTRVGLEDTLQLPDGRPAADNAALVTALLELEGSRRKAS